MIYSQQELVRQAQSYPHPQHIPPSRQQPPQPHWDVSQEQYNLLRHNKDISKAVAKESNRNSTGSTNAVMTGSTPELANSIQQQVLTPMFACCILTNTFLQQMYFIFSFQNAAVVCFVFFDLSKIQFSFLNGVKKAFNTFVAQRSTDLKIKKRHIVGKDN